jgi:hypothetical protein
VFILPDGFYNFIQSNNETKLNHYVIEEATEDINHGTPITAGIEEKRLLKTAILSEKLQKIGNEAFRNTLLTSITIPNSVEIIGYGAFWGAPLTSITIPDSVTTIGGYAFENSQLASITFSENSKLTSISNYTFIHTPLTSITIPDSVTTIEYCAFSDSQIASITFSENSNLVSIGSSAFERTPLTSITIPDSVTTIEGHAFCYSSPLESHTCPIQNITINCRNILKNNVVETLNNMYNSYYTFYNDLRAECLEYIQNLKVALSSSLVAEKSHADLKTYVAEILDIPTENALINAIFEKSGRFELDLSNTKLTPSDISDMPKSLPWDIIFANAG